MAKAQEESPRKLARRSDDVQVREDLTDITILLDRSGSMGDVRNDTIEGFNKLLREQQELPGDATLTLIQFDDRYEVNYAAKPIKDCPFLSSETYVPRGGTRLFDSVGQAMAEIEERLNKIKKDEDRPGKVVLIVLTDGGVGGEHSSELSLEQFRDRVKAAREQKQWTIALVGCEEATLAQASAVGLSTGNNIAFSKSRGGTKAVLRATSKGLGGIRGQSMASYGGMSSVAGPSGPSGPPGPVGYDNFASLAALTPEEDAQARASADWTAPDTKTT